MTLSKTKVLIRPVRASAAHCAVGRLAKKTSGLVPANMNGTRSTLEAYAQLASVSGLKPSASLAVDGRRIPIGTHADPALNEAIAEVLSHYRSLYGGRCRSQCVCVATVRIPLK